MLVLLLAVAHAALPIGYFDAASETSVAGWAYDPDHPNDAIAMHIYVDGQFAGAGATDGLRPDVNAAFGISGTHGFGIPIRLSDFGYGQHSIVAYAIDPDGQGNPGIDNSPRYVTNTCQPSCAGRACGDDGCGGSCGTCGAGACGPAFTCTGPPTGSLDSATQTAIGGWASDPDWPGPIPVHIYVDGQLMKATTADAYRADVGAHAFHWDPDAFGSGNHEVVAFGIGVNAAGAPDGQNVALAHSPRNLVGTCDTLTADALGWCQGLPGYWPTRQADTTYVGNDSVRVGLNRSYGGTIFQLYGPGWDDNLVLEHGGGAVQLSIWGYDMVGGLGWFATDTCDATPYTSEAACRARHASCSAWAFAGGAHVSDCVQEQPCPGWTPGSPWNPIQAQGPSCGWISPANDANAAGWQGDTFYTRLDAPFHFTSTQGTVPMPMEQWVTPHWGYVEIRYRLTYNGPYTWSPHPQEIPAFFTAPGINQHFYYYGGDHPFTGDAVRDVPPNTPGYVRYADRPAWGHGDDTQGYTREGWWGACDATGDRCVTIASFSPVINEVALQANQGGGSGYITALGYFGVSPGMSLDWTIYVFPKRYDQISGDRTVRQHIYDLAPAGFVTDACVPACAGHTCGDDGCGGSCGTCAGTQTCGAGQCLCDEPCGDCLGHTWDADRDNVCDAVDLCLGADATGDVDHDGVCGDRDACSGDDATGDIDSDGVCNDTDLCVGDERTGDSDGDGVCDDLDLTLQVSALRAGQPVLFRVTNATPGATATFVVSPRPGAGPTCHPHFTNAQGAPLCVALTHPVVVGSAPVRANGEASVSVNAPAGLPAGTTVRAQAAVVSGGVGDLTEVDERAAQ